MFVAPIQPERSMFKKILVPLDHSPLAEQAVGPATALARAAKAELDLVLVHEPFTRSGYEAEARHRDRLDYEHKYLKSIAAEITAGASVPTTIAVASGAPAEMICDRARTVDADLIVMTSHGRTGISRAWLGSSSTPRQLLCSCSGRPTPRRAARRHRNCINISS
jgi:nucleotide-binding universal stress UspA family protein